MKKLVVIPILYIITTLPAWSKVIVDVFGVEPQLATKIEKEFSNDIQKIEKHKELRLFSENLDTTTAKKLDQLLKQKKALIAQIKNKYDLEFVDIQTIQYPNNEDLYSTIEVVQKKDTNRIKLMQKQEYLDNSTLAKSSTKSKVQGESTQQFASTAELEKKSNDKKSNSNDSIDKMIEFQLLAMRLIFEQKIEIKNDVCPVYHCIAPFNLPQLSSYLTTFNHAAKYEKEQIINALNNDKNQQRRAAAAFLVGHFSDPKEIVRVLTPKLDDNSYLVRNNAMRVIGSTIAKSNLTDIDAKPFISQLDTPSTVVRNKALYVLSTLSMSKNGKKQLQQFGKDKLLNIAHLKQPNNHDIAKIILDNLNMS